MRSTKSNSSESSAAATSSTISTAMRSISSWRNRIARGVKRGMATLRKGPCRGGSSVTIISVGCEFAPIGPSMSPCAFENATGCDATATMSACFVIAQNG